LDTEMKPLKLIKGLLKMQLLLIEKISWVSIRQWWHPDHTYQRRQRVL